MKWDLHSVLSKCILGVCIILMGLTLGCASQKYNSQSKPTPNILNSAATATEMPQLDVLLPCANGQNRNNHGNCPNMPLCTKRCTWNKGAPVKQQCWTYLGKNVVTGFSDQRTPDDKLCAWVKE